MKFFNCLMFIDDNYPTNFYHNEIASEADVAEELIFFEQPAKALEHLQEIDAKNEKMPDIIFLDINMPEMNSWEFIDQYQTIIQDQSSKIVILTTSNNPQDRELAEQNIWVDSFLLKPLTLEFFQDLPKHFPPNYPVEQSSK